MWWVIKKSSCKNFQNAGSSLCCVTHTGNWIPAANHYTILSRRKWALDSPCIIFSNNILPEMPQHKNQQSLCKMVLRPIIDQGFRLQVYTKEFHMEPPEDDTKALSFRGSSLMQVWQSWNPNAGLGLRLARFYCVISFAKLTDADQTQQFPKLQANTSIYKSS